MKLKKKKKNNLKSYKDTKLKNQINQLFFVERYNFKLIEEKWQKYWEQNKIF